MVSIVGNAIKPGGKRARSSLFIIVDGLPFGRHALMQDAGDQNTPARLTIEHNVLATFYAAEAGANMVTSPAR